MSLRHVRRAQHARRRPAATRLEGVEHDGVPPAELRRPDVRRHGLRHGEPPGRRQPRDPFHETVSVWRDEWDEAFNTVRPEAMVDATIDAQERFPDKRIISHFVQPHYPFIGEFGRTLVDEQAGMELSKRQATGETAESDHYNVWDLLQQGVITEADLWKGYNENLQLTLDHVEDLLEELVGRTVVTSDHGNLVGERPTPCPVPFSCTATRRPSTPMRSSRSPGWSSRARPVEKSSRKPLSATGRQVLTRKTTPKNGSGRSAIYNPCGTYRVRNTPVGALFSR
ncbi:hypothetical protein ACFQH8_12560 [Halomicroarcula sp. GCM10025710]